jgi:hypothetical protein
MKEGIIKSVFSSSFGSPLSLNGEEFSFFIYLSLLGGGGLGGGGGGGGGV